MKNNKVVVVIGSGRSGTSLTMQLLEKFGMAVSRDMIGGKEQNSYGAFEDKEIFWLQERLQAELMPNGMPPFDGWLDKKITKDTINKIVEIIQRKIESGSAVWGFKDPRTALFIPMWTMIFNQTGMVPKYILAVRAPEAVIVSMKQQYNINEYVSEVFWLTKYTEALQNTGGNCFILHYEELFGENKNSIVKELLEFTGLVKNVSNDYISNILNSTVKSNLNRSKYGHYNIVNSSVVMLYRSLKKCRGLNFNKSALMAEIIKCRKTMNGFLGGAIEAHRFQQLNDQSKDNEKLVLQMNKYLKELKEKDDDLENLNVSLNERVVRKSKNNHIISQLEKELFLLKTSTSYRLGQTFVKAIVKPGKETILLPYNFLKVIFEKLFVRKYM